MRWIVALGMSLAVSLLAYAMLDAQNSRVGESVRSSPNAKMVTVAGCLQQTAQGSTTSNSAASSSSDQFMLANATMGEMELRTGAERNGSSTNPQSGNAQDANAPAADGTARAARNSPMPSAASSYMLQGSTEELRLHVNHQVEITGTLEASGTTASDSRPSAATSDNQRSSTSDQPSPATSSNHTSSTDNQPSSTTSVTQLSSHSDHAQIVATSGASEAQRRLAVQSVRMISANCSNP